MPKRTHERVCENCGKTYETSNATKCCSVTCRDELRRKRIRESAPRGECPVCGAEEILYWTAFGTRVCSVKCVRVINQRKWRGVDLANERNKRPKAISCAWCSKEFAPRRFDSKFCSRQCKLLYFRNKRKAERADRRNVDECSLCGVSIAAIPTAEEIGFMSFGEYARSAKTHTDHIVPRALGGRENADNLRVVCWMCNHIRGTIDQRYDAAVAAASRAFWTTITG